MPLFHIFNIVFIATVQHALLLAIVAPLYVTYLSGFTGWTNLDMIFIPAFALLLILETVTDEQQWRFQTKKYAVKRGELKLAKNDPDYNDIQRGFCTSGIFRYSRHANFWAEQLMWWCVYGCGVASTVGKVSGEGWYLNWSLAGAVALTALFQVGRKPSNPRFAHVTNEGSASASSFMLSLRLPFLGSLPLTFSLLSSYLLFRSLTLPR